MMLHVSQSVVLDYFSKQTTRLLEETHTHTLVLEQKGKLDISGRSLKRFIGKTLNLKNRIAENLELFRDIMQHRKSTALAWVIIALILVEVVNLVVEKIYTK
jgi:uncharacterized Rmd1/YagE family protein